ncbi:peritrophin-1-like [Phlebotomus argentipes]|uniref:peritrophin-1-like n=1 Tax=Phlebotomus argentipes TaxID=94469 RepID=UPI002893108A|nr:peritrophin-1-like [Phlebotomus argentipes]
MGVSIWIIGITIQIVGILASVQYPCPPFSPFRLPHTTSCSKFVQCIGGVATVHDCDNGLEFNSIWNECTLPEFADCDREYSPCPLFNDPDNLVYLSDSDSCEVYHLCYNNQLHRFQCIDGLHWDNQRNQCRRPADAGCAPSGVTCPPSGTHLVPNPVSCEYFYFCIDGHGYGSQCPEGTLFDVVRSFCVPADEATCLGPVPTTTARPTPPVVTTPGEIPDSDN